MANEYLKLTEVWEKASKEAIAENVRKFLEEKNPECQNSFNAIWQKLMDITGSKKHTVYAWLNKSRNDVKIPLLKLCMIADELDVDIFEFLK